jgi:hypothetical protein
MTGIHNVIVKPLSHLFNPIPCLFCAFETPDTLEMEAHIEIIHPEWEAQLQYLRWKRIDIDRPHILRTGALETACVP